jgi:hypothetical protein
MSAQEHGDRELRGPPLADITRLPFECQHFCCGASPPHTCDPEQPVVNVRPWRPNLTRSTTSGVLSPIVSGGASMLFDAFVVFLYDVSVV